MFTGNLENYPRNILHFPSKGWDAVSNGALFRLSEIYTLAYLVSYDISIYAIRFNLESLNRRDEFIWLSNENFSTSHTGGARSIIILEFCPSSMGAEIAENWPAKSDGNVDGSEGGGGGGGSSGMTLREMSLVKQCQTREHLEKVARVHPSNDRELASESTFHIISARVSSTIINVLSIYHRDPRVACPRGLSVHFEYTYV